jgi:hypothetical protein
MISKADFFLLCGDESKILLFFHIEPRNSVARLGEFSTKWVNFVFLFVERSSTKESTRHPHPKFRNTCKHLIPRTQGIYFISNFTVRVRSILHYLQFFNFQALLNHKCLLLFKYCPGWGANPGTFYISFIFSFHHFTITAPHV